MLVTYTTLYRTPSTAAQVWMGLAMDVVVTDENEAKLPIPKNYGVDEFPVILQDRTFHKDNQLDYRADYDAMGVFGETPLINGTVRPYVDEWCFTEDAHCIIISAIRSEEHTS